MSIADTVTFLVRHPVRSALRGVGIAKGLAGAVVGHGSTPSETAPAPSTQWAPSTSIVPPQREPLPAAEQRPPAAPGESFATEASPVSFGDVHADAPHVHDWDDEAEAGPQEDLVPETPDDPDASDAPLLDPSLTKQVKGELDRGLGDASR
ncbi:hypothetical protein D9V37_14585 [Nocardioides mangrovicus]|uniref:Uncharacterized protein n=1 Tax=Nocardioides mangrovicus TaxID=2478913 RepID=A0A3L8P0Y9_9ACTN|nr:hypothetical protein [Nocardioides mangrovicus]RLV48587.1 hypothetical protein D9V37_14585 [Nocardioides mangrovicus]